MPRLSGVAATLLALAGVTATIVAVRHEQRHQDPSAPWFSRHRAEGPSYVGGGPGNYRYAYGHPVKLPVALASFADARCAHEARCGQLGASHSTECETAARATGSQRWQGATCDDGLDVRELNECVAALRAADCSMSAEQIETIPECRRVEVCDR